VVEKESSLQQKFGNRPWFKRAMDSYDNSKLFPYSLIVPVLLFFIVWNLIPTLWMIGMSFYNYAFTTGKPERFNGINNLIDILNNDTVWGNLGRTFSWVIVTVGVETILGVLLAFLFWNSAKLPGRRLAMTLLFTPMLIAPASVGAFWKLLYEPDFGVINYLLSFLGISKINFLGDLNWAFPAVTLVDIWMWTPFMILITLAALGSVPKAELEAAEIDRLPWVKRLIHIILPYGKFVLMLGILLRTIDSFKTMDLIFMLTRGGPGNTTELVAIGLYRKAFEAFTMGWSSSLAILLLFTAIAFTSVYLYILNLSNAEKE
jgi:multiple sugar transport system permease protein